MSNKRKRDSGSEIKSFNSKNSSSDSENQNWNCKKSKLLLSNDMDLYLSLQEIQIGCTKVIKYKRFIRSGDKLRSYDEKIEVEVPPGCPNETKFIFEEKGDRIVGKSFQAGDVVVTVRYKYDPIFIRDSSNISLKSTVTKSKLKRGATLNENESVLLKKKKKLHLFCSCC